MILISNEHRRNYPFDPALNFGFEKSKKKLDFTFVISLTDAQAISSISGKKVYFDLEEPNRFFTSDGHLGLGLSTTEWSHYLTIDPFSNIFFRDSADRKGEAVFIPTDPERVPNFSKNRRYDVVYTGHIVSGELESLLVKIGKHFRLAVISGSNHPLVTHNGLNYDEKFSIISESKVAIAHNVLWPTRSHVRNVKTNLKNWQDHGAFSDLSSLWPFGRHVPQLKSRIFEAAFCGTIPIVFSDSWHLASNFFPSDLFVECHSENVIDAIGEAITNRSSDHRRGQNLRDYAFENYTTEKFIESFLAPLS